MRNVKNQDAEKDDRNDGSKYCDFVIRLFFCRLYGAQYAVHLKTAAVQIDIGHSANLLCSEKLRIQDKS